METHAALVRETIGHVSIVMNSSVEARSDSEKTRSVFDGDQTACESSRRIHHPRLTSPRRSSWQTSNTPTKRSTASAFYERSSKRRKGFPSETQVKRGVRVIGGDKWLEEKLGRNDPCPCGSNRKFRHCCLRAGRFRRQYAGLLFSASETAVPPRSTGRFSPPPARPRATRFFQSAWSSGRNRSPVPWDDLPDSIPRPWER